AVWEAVGGAKVGAGWHGRGEGGHLVDRDVVVGGPEDGVERDGESARDRQRVDGCGFAPEVPSHALAVLFHPLFIDAAAVEVQHRRRTPQRDAADRVAETI